MKIENEFEDLENEMRTMVPRSPAAELRERISAEIQSIDVVRTRRGSRVLAVLGGLGVAACIGFVMLKLPVPQQHDLSQRSASVFVAPTVQNYLRAWSNSPEDLDKLLDEHAHDFLQKDANDGVLVRGSFFN